MTTCHCFLEFKTFLVDFIIEDFFSPPRKFHCSQAKIPTQNISFTFEILFTQEINLPKVVLFPMMLNHNSFLYRFILDLVQEMVAMCLSKNYHYTMCIQFNKKRTAAHRTEQTRFAFSFISEFIHLFKKNILSSYYVSSIVHKAVNTGIKDTLSSLGNLKGAITKQQNKCPGENINRKW